MGNTPTTTQHATSTQASPGSNYGAGTINGLASVIETPWLWTAGQLSSALGSSCASIGDTSCALSAAQGANTAQQMITHPLPIGNAHSGAYKWGFCTGPVLVGAMLGVRGALAQEAAEEEVNAVTPRVIRAGDLKLPGVPEGATGAPVQTGPSMVRTHLLPPPAETAR
jgi:hypothetical protein